MNEKISIICITAAIAGSQLLWVLNSLKSAENYYQWGIQDILLAALFAAAAYIILAIKEKKAAAQQNSPVIRMYSPQQEKHNTDHIA